MSEGTTRRQFLRTAAVGAAAISMSAASYARIKGANERISIGMIGCGDRGRNAHMTNMHRYAEEQNVEITAVCDVWRENRERAAADTQSWYGRTARQFVSYKDVVALEDIDAVMIASCDHQHTTHLKAAADAKKDVYCEKPIAMDFDRLKEAYDAVKANGVVFQAGTQLRSMSSMTGAREVYRSGKLGTVGRIEQCRNGAQPYWYSRVKDVKEADVDWNEFLMDRESRPFDSVQYSGWYGFRDFSDGPVPGLGSHFIDLVHYITGATFPKSAICMGGTYTWKDDYKFTCHDHVHALWEYPEGFIVSYSTNFGNGSGNSFKFFGDAAVLDCVEWGKPMLTSDGINAAKGESFEPQEVALVERPDHFLDWLQCLRSRETPNASIEAGYQHGVATLMAMKACNTGVRQIYDAEKREIRSA
ncbi:MAG TPA: Gfo/Idh/MocA family oxidoreductase [Candidatus Hydrogenedentes bacterium]|nr:Gfo/Idh/MocA family oxidoreductase [Candidatus Hydrogenedentota bacterium]HQE81877.1 Gfo/Idh/MocA family oxidoreductase [Candidatus Hydrogenedentota bacterium]HQH51156.1 Gfo/Idh/MocA family oxidoreductase [Candidatus Hydrogenedentota bacterium]HQM47462.1 Gfo/Idh/MocA family oxidoreductase [Candidatus Hydrogenedentota bacterium]